MRAIFVKLVYSVSISYRPSPEKLIIEIRSPDGVQRVHTQLVQALIISLTLIYFFLY